MKKTLAVLLAGVALIISAYYFIQPQQSALVFPETLGGLTLHSLRSGQDVAREISGIHLVAENVTMKNGTIAIYFGQKGEFAQFWVSEEESAEVAKRSFDQMIEKMRRTKLALSQPVEINLGAGLPAIYFTEGQSLYHYFYAKQNRVFWIALSNPDESERLGFVREAISRIG